MIEFPRFMRRFAPSENSILIGLAVAVGLACGIGVYIFRSGIEFFHYIFFEQLSETIIGSALASAGIDPHLSIIPVLTFAGFIVGIIMVRFVGHEKHHGVAGIMESVALTGGRLPYQRMPFKIVASMLSLGAGASVGPEDPSVQIGSNIGSFFGQKLHLGEDRVRLLVSAGAASAIAAAFNAPVAGVFFALEVILGEFTARSFGVVVLSAVISSGFTQALRGDNPIFAGLSFDFGSPLNLPLYALLGILLAFVSAFALRIFNWQTHVWHNWLRLPVPVETALTGALVGAVGVIFPQILGPNEAFMHDVLTGHVEGLTIGFLLVLGFVKLFMTAASIAGGFVGGVFAPTLFMGIVWGEAFGMIANNILPGNIGQPQAYAIAGMAGLLAGIVRAPITAVLLVFEITNDYALILPIMLTSVICIFIVEQLGPAGIYMLSLIKHGIYLQQGRDIDVMQGVTVSEAMVSPAPTIHENASLSELRDAFHRQHTRALCVVNDEGDLLGVVTLGDLQATFENAIKDETDLNTVTVGNICTREPITASPDDVLWTAIRNMGARDIGRLPVVKEGTRELVGMLRRHDIMDAYNMAIARKLQDQHYAEQIRLNTLTGAHVLEYRIRHSSPVLGQRICDITWPPEAVVASIQRRGKLIVPHGSTDLLAGDILTIVADREAEILLNELFNR